MRVNSELCISWEILLDPEILWKLPGQLDSHDRPCVVTARVTGSDYNCQAQNPSGKIKHPRDSANHPKFMERWTLLFITWWWWHWAVPWIESWTCCVSLCPLWQLCPQVPHGHQCPPHIICHHHVNSWTSTTNKLNQIGSRSSMLRSFSAFFARRPGPLSVTWSSDSDGERRMMVVKTIRPLSITCSLILVISRYRCCAVIVYTLQIITEAPALFLIWIIVNSLAMFRPNLSWSISEETRIGSGK